MEPVLKRAKDETEEKDLGTAIWSKSGITVISPENSGEQHIDPAI